MDSAELHRLRSEVNTLWRRILEGETKVEASQEGSLRVGVLTSINPINANRLRDGLLLNYLTHGDIAESPSMKMKKQVTDLVQKVNDLQMKIDHLSGQVCESVLKQSSNSSNSIGLGHNALIRTCIPSKFPQMESIKNHAAYVKVQFQMLKRNGSQVYVALEELENELLKDIGALKEVIQDEDLVSSVACRPKRNFRSPDKNCKEKTKYDVESASACNDAEVHENTSKYTSQAQASVPCSVPYFKHKWDGKDHQHFLRVHGKFRARDEKLGRLCRMFPYKTEHDITSHLDAYEAFLKEKELVKKQINVWRHKKEVEKQILEEKNVEEREAEERKQQMILKAKEAKRKREREAQYREIALWKSEINKREGRIRLENSANACMQESRDSHGKDTARRDRPMPSQAYTANERKDIAVRLKDYYGRRDLEMQKEKKQKEKEEFLKKEKFSVHHRAQFLEKTYSFMNQKKAKKGEKEKLAIDVKERLEKMKVSVKVNVERDRDRLLKPTQSHLAYKATYDGGSTSVNPVSIDAVSHLGVPVWRQGL